jgi:hypothetical protein
MKRIIDGLMLKQSAYNEAANDPTFTPAAWLIVFVTTLLSQFGANAVLVKAGLGIDGWAIGTALGLIFSLVGFVLACAVVIGMGRAFGAGADFGRVVRALSLAYMWQAVNVLGIVNAVAPELLCVPPLVQVIAWIAMFVALVIAVRAALTLDTGKAVVLSVLAIVVILVTAALSGMALGAVARAVGGF